MMTDAIADAVELLRVRRHEALTEIGRLQGEVTRIDGALSSLGGDPSPSRGLGTNGHQTSPDEQGGRTQNLTSAVHEAIESIDKWWSIDDLAKSLLPLQGERSDEQLRGTIRTALWSLRKRGQIVSNGHGRHKARRYVADPTDTSAPATTGAEASGTTTARGGEVASGHDDHDPNHHSPEWDRDRRGDPAIGEMTSAQ